MSQDECIAYHTDSTGNNEAIGSRCRSVSRKVCDHRLTYSGGGKLTSDSPTDHLQISDPGFYSGPGNGNRTRVESLGTT